ncbi:hypothetical protein LINGRAHAP2_LOCUS16820 [Linum grandiflorum]
MASQCRDCESSKQRSDEAKANSKITTRQLLGRQHQQAEMDRILLLTKRIDAFAFMYTNSPFPWLLLSSKNSRLLSYVSMW